MVEELDLSDQDVCTISEMIEAEIRSYIPDWTSVECSVDNLGAEVATDSSPSEARNVASPLSIESGNLALEVMSSGRKYWSDSPKGIGESSPNKPGLSNLSCTETAESSSSHIHGDKLDHAAIIKGLESELLSEDGVNDGEDEANDDEQDEGSSTTNLHASYESNLSEENSGVSEHDESSDVEIMAKRLENLLKQQQEEIDELKRKHKLAISELLIELTPESYQKVLEMCKLKHTDFELAL